MYNVYSANATAEQINNELSDAILEADVTVERARLAIAEGLTVTEVDDNCETVITYPEQLN